MARTYYVGDALEIVIECRLESTQALIDPTTLTVTIRDDFDSGRVTNPPTTGTGINDVKVWPANPEVVRTAVGQFKRTYTATQAGVYSVRAVAAGAVAAVELGSFTINP